MKSLSLAALALSLLLSSLLTPVPASQAADPTAALLAARNVVPAMEHLLLGGRPASAGPPAPQESLSAGLAPCDGGGGLYLYAERDYAGECLKLTTDTPRLGDLGFNDVTSSIRFVGSVAGGHRTAELYVDGDYGGAIQIVSSDVPWMGDTAVGNDQLSSVRFGFSCAGVSQIPHAECQALVDLYNQTNGRSWSDRTGWLKTGTPCDWFGLECTAGHVSLLSQVGNHLQGSIPGSLGNLSRLQGLNLEQNELGGSIPSELGNLGSLKQLQLSDNNLTGGIPSTLGSLASLTWLALDDNDLTGSVPSTLRYLHNLIGLRVDDNSLGGPLPLQLMELTALEVFHFENTGLCEPPDAAFQAWLGTMLECGRTNVLCTQPSPSPTPTSTLAASPTPTGTTAPGSVRVYLPLVLLGYSTWSHDEFNSTVLDGRWTWLNEDPTAWSLTARPGYLRLRTHAGGVGDKNLLLRPAPASNWGARTRIEFAPTTNFQSAGLVVWGGPGNVVKLGRAFCGLGPPNCVGDGIYFDHIEGGAFIGSNYATPWPSGSPVHLRIERVGAKVDAYCSADGLSWSYVGSHTVGLTVLGVGLSADQGTPGSTAEADFDYFRAYLASPRPIDFTWYPPPKAE